MPSTPQISVIMPVHNFGHLLKESIDSVLVQSMPDFELIIVNDGSTDNSSEIARSFLDRRIKVIDFSENRGCYPARNAGMIAATGKYFCVMDADDVCLPERLEKQYIFMEENSDLGLIGGAYIIMNSNNFVFRESEYDIIKLMMLTFCYLHHPTCMVRSCLIEKYDLYYDESYTYASDYNWQVRASSLFTVSNINEPVLLYRRHFQQISSNKSVEQGMFADRVRINQLINLGIAPTKSEIRLHLSFIKGINDDIPENQIEQWITRLIEGNQRTKYYSHQKFQDFLFANREKYNILINQNQQI